MRHAMEFQSHCFLLCFVFSLAFGVGYYVLKYTKDSVCFIGNGKCSPVNVTHQFTESVGEGHP